MQKKSPKIFHLGTIAQFCRAVALQLRHVSTIGKNLLNSNISSTCPHNMANEFASCLRYCSDVAHPRPTKLCMMFGRLCAGALYIHFWGLLPPDEILPGAKFTLRPSLAFSYIGSVTARHFSSGHQPNFVAWYKEWNYGTFAESTTYIRQGGHHIGHWPTF